MAFTFPFLSSQKKKENSQQDAVPAQPPASGANRLLERLLDDARLPLIGHLPLQRQIRLLLILVGAALLLSAFFVWQNMHHWAQGALQTQITGDAVMHSQRLGKAAPKALQGNPEAFRQLEESRREISLNLKLLASGGDYLGAPIEPPAAAVLPSIRESQKMWGKSEQAADAILSRKKALTGFGATLEHLSSLSPALLGSVEKIAALKVQSGAAPRDILALGQLMMLSQRLERSVGAFTTSREVSLETAFLLGKDANLFRAILDGLLNGSEELKLNAEKDPEVRARLAELQKAFEGYRQSVAEVRDNLERSRTRCTTRTRRA